MSSTIRASIITLSFLNPQTNQYQQMGQLPIVIMRIQGKLQIILFKSKTQALFGIDPNEPNNWTITNQVYATYIDKNNRVWLFLFKNAEECLLFSMVALYGKLKSRYGAPVVLVNGNGGQIMPTQDIKVNSKVYNLKEPNLDNPTIQDDVSIYPTDTTPLQNLFNGGVYGATHLVFYEDEILAIATVRDPNGGSAAPQEQPAEQSLPQTQTSAPAETPKQEEKKVEESKPAPVEGPKKTEESKKIEEPKKIEEQKKPEEPKKADEPKRIEEKPKSFEERKYENKIENKPEQKKDKAVFDAQLEQIRTEMYNKFNELSQMVTSIKRQQQSRAATPQSSDILVASVERLIRENELKDRLISEKQQLIEMLNAKKNNTQERDELRKQLADLTAKVSATKEATRKKQEEKKELESRIESLQKKVAAAKSDSESKLASIRRDLEAERQKTMADLEQSKQQLQWSVNKADEEVKELKKKLAEAEALNKELKSKSGVDSAKELEKLKAAADNLLINTVKKLVAGVFQNCQKLFSTSNEFDGAQVIKGVRAALQAQAEEILSELEPDD